MTREQKLDAAKAALGKKYVFHPERQVTKRRDDVPILVLALAARLAGRK